MGRPPSAAPVPGHHGSEYAIELIPRTGGRQCNWIDPVNTMIEQSGTSRDVPDPRHRLFRTPPKSRWSRRSSARASSTSSTSRSSRPRTPSPTTTRRRSTALTSSPRRRSSRAATTEHPGFSPTQDCDQFTSWAASGSRAPRHERRVPGLQRTAHLRPHADGHDLGLTSAAGWNGCSGSSPDFVGTFVTNAPVLTPPPTNGSLRTVAGRATASPGQTKSSSTTRRYTVNGGASRPFPPTGSSTFEQRLLGRVQPLHGHLPGDLTCGNV